MALTVGRSLVLAAAITGALTGRGATEEVPSALRVWASDIHDAEDREAGGSPPSLTIVGARNGVFSGKVVVSSGQGLRAVAGDLKLGPAVIPVSSITIRYAVPWQGKLAGGSEAKGPDILLEAPPEASSAGQVPVWVTVKVPADAAPGTYTGELTVSAGGASPVRVPVKLEVCDWSVPDPGEYRTWVEMIQSPDTLAVEYGVPLWSEKHFELIGRSHRFLGEIGSRVLYIPLIEHTNVGNEQSMVRWTRAQGEKRWGYDFSAVDKYLDLAEKHMGKPKMVVFNVWDRYLTRPGAGGRDFQTQTGLRVATTGPVVTAVDPATGTVQHVLLPDYPLRESATVVVDRFRETTTAEQYLQKRLEQTKEKVADFEEHEKGSATMGGQEARWAAFSCSMGPFRSKALLYATVQKDRGIAVTCLSRPEKFDRCKGAFEKIAAGLRLQEKDLVLECPEGWEKGEFRYRDAGIGTGTVAIVWGPEDGPGEANPVREAWKSLFDQLRERMRKRGLEQTMMLGMVSDFWATKQQVAFLKDVSGDLPWANASHYFRKPLWDIAEVKYHAFYFGVRFGYKGSLYGWKRPEIAVTFDRAAFLDGWPMARWRHMGECSITGNVRGVGRVGADTWNVLRDKNGQRKGRVYERYRETDWGYLNIRSSLLAPGSEGALATARYEALREGIQDCEARIVIERALTDEGLKGKLGAELVARCEEALAERQQCLWKAVSTGGTGGDAWRKGPCPQGHAWFLGSSWQERSRKLYALAGEVERKTGAAR